MDHVQYSYHWASPRSLHERNKAEQAGQVSKLFSASQRCTWGFLLERQDEDVLKLEARRVVVRNEKEVERYLRISREAASLLFWGHINKAIRRLNSNNVARADSVETTPRQREEVRPYPLPGLADGGPYQDEGSGVSRMLRA